MVGRAQVRARWAQGSAAQAVAAPTRRRGWLAVCLGGALVALGPAALAQPVAEVVSEDAPPAPEAHEDRLPAGEATERARQAYNDGQYAQAAAQFLVLSQQHPELPALYRALARSRSLQADHVGSALAYEVYLQMAPQAKDREKIQQEQDLVLRKAQLPKADLRTRPALKGLERAQRLAGNGQLSGEKGALAQIQAALAEGFFGPELEAAQQQVVENLKNRAREILQAWWAPQVQLSGEVVADFLQDLEQYTAWRGASPQEELWRQGVRGLGALGRGDAEQALRDLETVSGADTRLIFAQALALVSLGRDEAALGLLEQLEAQLPDPRVFALRGLVLNRLGRAQEALGPLLRSLEGP